MSSFLDRMKPQSLFGKILLVGLGSLVIVFLASWLFLVPVAERGFLNVRKTEIRSLTETALGILQPRRWSILGGLLGLSAVLTELAASSEEMTRAVDEIAKTSGPWRGAFGLRVPPPPTGSPPRPGCRWRGAPGPSGHPGAR